MKKKIAAASIALALALVLGACNKSEETNPNDVDNGEATPGSGAIDHGVDDNKVGFSMSGDQVEEATDVPDDERKAILEVFNEYIETFNNQDIDGYLATLSKEGYDAEEERAVAEEMFKSTTIRRETDNETIVKYSEKEAQLFATMKTTLTDVKSGVENAPEGRQVTVFNKEDGQWKVFSIYFIGDENVNEPVN
ncbi:nuclear transport factor 2 family protein [Sporosarcina sp. GW1-11]|uniref:nuclear transport factor 2 family protein n=1 Tax=Sporosarcina sp. GW1-11 TaxID=2899126 RepID=UPI00294CB5B3|nr:nuclear transport factor 2 family protein [Sporosarcina sp. GW1-11]MDV6377021.1 nuclear transport factor 2 family protein [Sporosarcina sp. GW1-11]